VSRWLWAIGGALFLVLITGSYLWSLKPPPVEIYYSANLYGLLLDSPLYNQSQSVSPDRQMIPYHRVFGWIAQKSQAARFGGKISLYLAGGNSLLGGDGLSAYFQGEPMARLLGKLGCAAFLGGEEEFHLGKDRLLALSRSTTLPLVCSNITEKTSRHSPSFAANYVLIPWGKRRIAVMGYYVPPQLTDLPGRKSSFHDFEFNPDLSSLRHKIQGSHADYVVLMAAAEDYVQIATDLPEVNLIIPMRYRGQSGLLTGQQVGKTIIAPWCDGRFGIGLITLPSPLPLGQPTPHCRIVTGLPGSEPSPEYISTYEPYQSRFRRIFGNTFPQVSSSFLGWGDPSLSISRYYYREEGAYNLITWLIARASGVPLVLINQLSLRRSLDGPVSLADLGEALPFCNQVVLMNLTGKQLDEILRRNALGNRRFLQLHGARLAFESGKPENARITINGAPIETERTYRIATIDYLAEGARGKEPVFTKGTDVVHCPLFINYLLLEEFWTRHYLLPAPRWIASTPAADSSPAVFRGLSLWRSGRTDDARALWISALAGQAENAEMPPSLVQALPPEEINLLQGSLRENHADAPGALEQYQAGLSRAPRSLPLRMALGRFHYRLGDRALAGDIFREAVDQNPRSAEARFWLGLCYLSLYRQTESLASLRESTRLAPDNPLYFTFHGWAAYAAGRPGEAQHAWRKAAQLLPDRAVLSQLVEITAGLTVETPPADPGSGEEDKD